MTMKRHGAALLAIGLALGACTTQGGTTLQAAQLGSASVLATSPDLRLAYAEPAKHDQEGHVEPQQIVCTEPSADVAKAVSDAFGGSLEAQATGPQAGGDIAAGLAFSHARAEAIAQLGKRLATIQLLRDGLYRACEAYRNGAISEISYALLLSRYGDTMVTLLGIEMVSGDTQTPATLASPPITTSQNALPKPGEKDTDTKAQGLSQSIKIDPQQGNPNPISRVNLTAEQVKAIETLQTNYLRTSGMAPILVACASALDRKGNLPTSFATQCQQDLPKLIGALSNGLLGDQAKSATTRPRITSRR